MNANEINFRCSKLGALMTEPQSKTAKEAGELSETTKAYLREVYVQLLTGRKKEIESKYLDKGNAREEDALTMLNKYLNETRDKKVLLKKNEFIIENKFIVGELDTFDGDDIIHANEIFDTKCSWDVFTFYDAVFNTKVDKDYYWQGQGYMALSGATKHTIAYCLLNCTHQQLMDEKKRLQYKFGVTVGITDESTPEFKAYEDACVQAELNMIVDPEAFKKEYPGYDFECKYFPVIEKRIHLVTFERNDYDIERLYKRIRKCREYMNEVFFKEPALV